MYKIEEILVKCLKNGFCIVASYYVHCYQNVFAIVIHMHTVKNIKTTLRFIKQETFEENNLRPILCKVGYTGFNKTSKVIKNY